MEYIIETEKTAITNGVSNSCKSLVNNYSGGTVLDYGFGKLRNAKYMLENNICLDVLDTDLQIERNSLKIKDLNINNIYNTTDELNKEKYDAVLLSFVLNVIPDRKERIRVLKKIKYSLKENGLLYVEVRNEKFVENLKNKEVYEDGILIGSGKKKTFQKPFNLESISQFLNSNGFEVLDFKRLSGSIMLICSKK